MSKLMSLDKQVEQKAKKWFIDSQLPENRILAKRFFEENKKEIKDEYLEKHPKVEKEYKEKKKLLLKVKIALATTGLVATTIGAGACYHISNTNKEPQKDPIQIEQEEKLKEGIKQLEEQELEQDPYENFFDEVREMKSTEKRDEFITNQTKQVIVEAYNKEHPENPITTDRLETLILNENVLQKTDRLGNYTYERVKQNIQYEQTDTQKLVKIGNIYDFRIDGKTVAVFDGNGSVLQDKNVETQDISFKPMIQLLDVSQDLQDIYKYPSNDYQKSKVEEKYKQISEKILENKKTIDVEKEKGE